MTTPEIPSATVAKAATAPKMRFLYPLAAVCIAAVFMTPSNGQAQTAPSVEAQKQANTFKALGAALGKVNPIVGPFGGKPAKKLAEAQAVALVAGAVTNAVPQPEPAAGHAAVPTPSSKTEK